MSGTRKVLLISYYFPPYQSPGAIRASKFAKYLPEFGWSPVVLAAANEYMATLPVEVPEDCVVRSPQFDVNWLPKLLAGDSRVARNGYYQPSRTWSGRVVGTLSEAYRQLVNFPDGQIGWYPYAVHAGMRLIEREKPDVIFSSALPATGHLVAHRLAGQTQLPWAAEYRDMWVGNGNFRRVGLLSSLEEALERRVMSNADALVTVSGPLAQVLVDRFHKPTEVIPNGFDPSDYPCDVEPDARFTLTYTGILYPRKQDPLPLFHALSALRQRGLITPESFHLCFLGRNLEFLRDLISSFGLDGFVSITGTVAHRDSLRSQMQAGALLLFLWNGLEDKGWYSLKLFEYLGSRRLILAIGPRDTIAAELIRSANAGEVAETSAEIENVLLRWLEEHRRHGLVRSAARADIVNQFQRRALAGELARVFEQVLARRNSDSAAPGLPSFRVSNAVDDSEKERQSLISEPV